MYSARASLCESACFGFRKCAVVLIQLSACLWVLERLIMFEAGYVFNTSLLGGIEKLHVAGPTLAWLGQLQDHPVLMSSMHGVLHTTHYTSHTHTVLPLHTMYFPLCNLVRDLRQHTF